MTPADSLAAGQSVRVRVPASSANLGPGFDSLGMALGLWDDYVVTVTQRPGLWVRVSGEGAGQLPLDERHLVYRCFRRALDHQGVAPPPGVELDCRNGVPQGRGLGSSATAVVGGVAAAYALSGGLDRDAVNDLASAIEGHPDNASASIFGGMTLSWWDDRQPTRVRSIRLDLHPQVCPVVLLPAAQLATATARAVLPARVPHAEAALNAARAALLVEAVTRRPELLLPATREWLHQEQRRASFSASMTLVDRLRDAGHAATISGAGPSVLVLTTRDQVAAVRAAAQAPDWSIVNPGVARDGVQVDRVTLMTHPAKAGDRSAHTAVDRL